MPKREREEDKAVIRRRQKKLYAVFIDGLGLDRASRRLNKRVDLSALIRGVTAGQDACVSRYYTIIPFEDDHRHRAFLEAVERAGLDVVVKRLPPKGVNRQASIDPEMSADIIAFAMGKTSFNEAADKYLPEERRIKVGPMPTGVRAAPLMDASTQSPDPENNAPEQPSQSPRPADDSKRVVVVVCPSRDLSYAFALAGEVGADTVSVDFGYYKGDDVLKSASKWIDLSESETIWKG